MSKKTNLSQTINSIKKELNSGFDEVLKRIDTLEKSDACNSMDIRNLKIQMRAQRGDKQKDIAQDYGISGARVNQIIKELS